MAYRAPLVRPPLGSTPARMRAPPRGQPPTSQQGCPSDAAENGGHDTAPERCVVPPSCRTKAYGPSARALRPMAWAPEQECTGRVGPGVREMNSEREQRESRPEVHRGNLSATPASSAPGPTASTLVPVTLAGAIASAARLSGGCGRLCGASPAAAVPLRLVFRAVRRRPLSCSGEAGEGERTQIDACRALEQSLRDRLADGGRVLEAVPGAR